ncbi:flavin reductase family protein [Bosea sp. (in: a-proteobacteria)]
MTRAYPSCPSPHPVSAADPDLFRAAAGSFLTGVAIATVIPPGGQPCGITVNSFTAVSLDPPLVLFCVGRSSRRFDAFDQARSFAVNILSSSQHRHAAVFASQAQDKFAGIEWTSGPTGSPLLPKSLASFDCVLHEKIEAGDHIVLIGRVLDLRRTPGAPLGYFRGGYIDCVAPDMVSEEPMRASRKAGSPAQPDVAGEAGSARSGC